MNKIFVKYGDRVKVSSDKYTCAEVGEVGTIVDFGYLTGYGLVRYLVRWDNNPDILFGVHSDCIERIE